jgi:hypothetical protein
LDEGADQERETEALWGEADKDWGGEEVVLAIHTVIDAVEVLFDVSVESAQRVVEPFAMEAVFQDMEYKVPVGDETEPMSVLEAKDEPKEPE